MSGVVEPPSRYAAREPDRLIWEEVPDGWFIFDQCSGQTHFLNATAAEIIQLLQRAPSTLAEALDHLKVQYPAADPAQLRGHLERMLLEFQSIGLVWAIRS